MFFTDKLSLKQFLDALYEGANLEKLLYMDPAFDTFERMLFPSFIDMPKVSKVESIVENFWSSAPVANTIVIDRKPIYFVQASPGCGKTYTLREIGRFCRKQDGYGSRFVCIGISFNSLTPVFDIELNTAVSNPDTVSYLFSIPRIIFSLFVKGIEWSTFIERFHSSFSPTRIYSLFLKDARELISARYNNSDLGCYLLADEISKLRNDDYILKTRRFLCDIFTYCVFSSLYFQFIDDTQRFETSSGRSLIPLGRLGMFDMQDRIMLFQHYFNEYGFDIVDSSGTEYSMKQHGLVLHCLFNNLAVYTAGHPRTIDAIVLAMFTLLAKGRYLRLQEIFDDACLRMKNSLSPTFETIVAALLFDTVSYGDTIPGTDITYDKAVAEGKLIGSDRSSASYVPFLSPMGLANWRDNNLDTRNLLYRRFALHLDNMLRIQSIFSSKSFEIVAYTREALMSIVRYNSSTPPQSFREILLRRGQYSIASHLFDITLRSSSELEVSKFASIQDIVNTAMPGIFVPESSNNPGFDFLIRYSTTEGQPLNILYEIKYSDPTSKCPAKITKAAIGSKHSICKKLFGDKFIFVVLGWREFVSTVDAADLPENTVVFDRKELGHLFGPSISNFIDIQRIEEPQLISKVLFTKKT